MAAKETKKERERKKKSARKKKCGCYKCHSDYLSMMTQRFGKRSRSIRYGVATVFFLFVLLRWVDRPLEERTRRTGRVYAHPTGV